AGGFAGGASAEQAALEEVVMGASAGGGGLVDEFGVWVHGVLVLEKAFKDTDGGVEGGALACGSFAVPTAVGALLGEKATGERVRRVVEICTEGEDSAVDAWLLFAFKEWIAAGSAAVGWGRPAAGGCIAEVDRSEVPAAGRVVPPQVGFSAGEGGLDYGADRVDACGAQEQKGEEGRDPRGAIRAAPGAIGLLGCEDCGAESLMRDASALGSD